MKKLLSATLAIAMGATCVGTLSACNSTNDAETAQKAMQAIKLLYDKADLYETPVDYQVLGKVNVSETLYDVNWSVSADVNNITDYIKVGDMDAETSLVTVSVTKPEEAIEYNLTATITVGKATEKYDFKRKVPAKLGEISVDNPLSVSAAIALVNGLEVNEYYKENGEAKQVYVEGYVTDVGEVVSGTPGYIKNIHISETADGQEYINIGSLNYNELFAKGSTLNKGDKVVIFGYVEKMKNYVSMYAYEKQGYPTIAKIDRAPKSPTEVINSVKEELALPGVYVAAENLQLLTEKNGATLNWEVKGTSTVASVTDNKLTITDPDADTTATLTVHIGYGGETGEKDITINIVKASTKGTQADPYTAAEATAIAKSLTAGDYYVVNGAPKAVYVKGYVTVLGTWSAKDTRYNNMYIADAAGTAQADSLNVYSVTAQAGTALEKEGDVALNEQIILCGFIQYYKGYSSNTPEITYCGTDVVTVAEKVADTRSDTEKGNAALDALTIPTEIISKVVLNSTVPGVTLSIKSSSNTDAIALNGDVTRGSADAPVTLTIAAKIGENEVATKDFTVTVKATVVVDPGDVVKKKLTFTEMYEATTDIVTNNEANFTFDDVASVKFAKSTASNPPKYYTDNKGETYYGIRVYAKSTITVSVSGTHKIAKITFTFASGEGTNEITVDSGTLATDTWTGADNTNTVTFTIGGTSGHRRVAAIEIEYV